MLKIGITGNIGTGKTTVCKIFESLGIAVYYADTEAKKFYKYPDVIMAVKKKFGAAVFDEHEILIPEKLAKIVFQDAEKLMQLNAIIHPRVLDDLLSWAENNREHKYLLYESALLFESGFAKHFDKSILVTAPTELTRIRVMKRDHLNESDFQARAANQLPQKEKEAFADYIINNNEGSALIPQVIHIHKLLLNIHN